MSQNQNFPDLDNRTLKKLDGGIRRILFTEDEKLFAAIDEDNNRLKESIKRIEELEQLIPAEASKEDRQHIAKLKNIQYKKLVPNTLLGPLIVSKVPLEPIKISVIIKFAGNRDDLIAMGLEVSTQAQDIFTVKGTKQQIALLASQAATIKINLPRPMIPTVEHASAQAEIDQVHTPTPQLPHGLSGQGIIVGIIDSALDITHNTFKINNNETRVLYYWVQVPDDDKAPGQNPEEFDPIFKGLKRGRIYTKADIDKALGSAAVYGNGNGQISKMPEIAEHGTHVAGIAVGNGNEADWKKTPVHIGVAPMADIIYVCRGFNPALSDKPWEESLEDSILEGISFIFAVAEKEDKPVVINISQGCQMGPHNGNTTFDQALDNYVNSYIGRSIVVSAGNDNAFKGFIKGQIPYSSEKALELKVNPDLSASILDVWSTGPELDFKCIHRNVETAWYQVGQTYDAYKQGFIDLHRLDVIRDTEGGLNNIRFQIVHPNTSKYRDMILEPWTILLRNSSNVDDAFFYAWIGIHSDAGTLTGAVPDELTLEDTASAKSIITVGACEKLLPPNPDNGEKICTYSGAGPTLDLRTKPELVAVGGTTNLPIYSANSDQASGYIGQWGTSMSAPVVAGSIALLYEEYLLNLQIHGPSHNDIKALLIQTTNKKGLHLDPLTKDYIVQQRNQYGYGRLRMLAPAFCLAPLVDADVWIRTAEDDYGNEPFIGDVYWHSPDIHVRKPQDAVDLNVVKWGETYNVMITMHNLGIDPAIDCELYLKYTIPFAARSDWKMAKNVQGKIAKSMKFQIPAMSPFIITFEWKPDKNDFDNLASNQTHFCLLAEVTCPMDKIEKHIVEGQGVDPWELNIKGNNNIALKNIHIYD